MVKEKVLEILEENRGSSVSGGEIGRRVGASRTAVWKTIAQLKEEGHDIQTLPNAGYILKNSSDMISEPGIRCLLQAQVGPIEILPTVDSTNSYLKKNASRLPSGAVVIAEEQTGGRGRMGKTFYSPRRSGIYMSVLLRPDLQFGDVNLITVASAVAVSQAIEDCVGLKPSVKWINDLFYEGRKICGILTEASVEGESGRIEYVVIGVGINVAKSSFSGQLGEVAASLGDYSNHVCTRNTLVAAVLNRMEEWLLRLKNGQRQYLMEQYRSRLFVLGKKVTYVRGGSTFTGVAVGLDETAGLVVRKDDGEVEVLRAGEITLSRFS